MKPRGQRERDPLYPHPCDSKAWRDGDDRACKRRDYSAGAAGNNILTAVMVANAAPAVEVPTGITARQYFDIVDTQPDP